MSKDTPGPRALAQRFPIHTKADRLLQPCVRGCGRVTALASRVCVWCATADEVAKAGADILPLVVDHLDTIQGALEATKGSFKSKAVLRVREHVHALREALEKRAVRP